MAGMFHTTPHGEPWSERRYGGSWSCDTHDKMIKFYCEKRRIPLCSECIMEQRPHEIRDIEDVIKDLNKELQNRIKRIEQAKGELRDFNEKLDELKGKVNDHLNEVRSCVRTSCDGEIEASESQKREKVGAIKKKAADEIKRIEERREEEINQCKEEAELRQAPIRDLRGKLLGDVDRIAVKLCQYTDQLKEKSTATSHYIKDSEEHIRRLQKSDSELVNFAALAFEALDKTLEGVNNEEDITCAERAVLRVTCSVIDVSGILRGRIDTGEWARVDTISPELGGRVVGSVSDTEIGVTRIVNGGSSNILSIVDLKTHQQTSRIIAAEGSAITSCAAISSELIVCGKAMMGGDELTGWVSLYDRRDNLVSDITIPGRTKGGYAWVWVDVDGDGMVVAAQDGQPHIYVVNPADGAILRSVTLPNGEKVQGRISSLRDSSGDVVVCTENGVFSIVSRTGAVKTTIRDDEWKEGECSVDMVTGALYVAYYDADRRVRLVDRCTSEGAITEREVVKCPCEDGRWGRIVIIPAGKLVVSDRDGRIFHFNQSLNLTLP